MLISGIEILELIPQRAPMVMVDSLVSSDAETTVTNFTILPENIFLEHGVFSENGLIENIAQTAAAGMGYICKIENRKVPLGFIAAVKNLVVHSLPVEGDIISTKLNLITQVENISVAKGKVTHNGTLLAECELRIFLKPD